MTWTRILGAVHLYLIDFSPENLPNLKSTIERSYPDVKVRTNLSVLLDISMTTNDV